MKSTKIQIKRSLKKISVKSWIKDRSFQKLLKNSATLISGDVGATLINTFVLTIIMRSIGVSGYGNLVLIQTYVLIFDQIFNIQSWQAFIKFSSEAIVTGDDRKLKSNIKLGTIIDVSTAILGFCFAYAFALPATNIFGWDISIVPLIKLYSFSILFHFSGIPTGILRIYNQFKIFSVQKITVSIIKLIGILINHYFEGDLINIVYIFLLSDVIGNVLLISISHYFLLTNNIKKWWKEKITFKNNEFINFTLWNHSSIVTTVPTKQLDVIIISSTLSIEMVGVYKLFKQLSSLVTRIVDPIYQAIYPQLAEIIAEKKSNKAYNTAIKVSIIIAIAIVPLLIIVVVTSKWWLNVLFGELFSMYWIHFGIFITLMSFDTITSPLHPLFNALGLAKQKFIITTVGNLLFLLFAYFLSIHLSILGVILAWGIQFVVITGLKFIYLIKESDQLLV